MVNAARIMETANESKASDLSRKNKTGDTGLFAQLLTIQGSQTNPPISLFHPAAKETRDVEPAQKSPAKADHKKETNPTDQKQTEENKGPANPPDSGQGSQADSSAGVDGCVNGVPPGASTEAAVNAHSSTPSSEISDELNLWLRQQIALSPAILDDNPEISAKTIDPQTQVFGPNLNLSNEQILFETGLAENFIRLLTDQFTQMKNTSADKKDAPEPSPALPGMSSDSITNSSKILTTQNSSGPQIPVTDENAVETMNRIAQIIRSNLGRRQSQMTVQLDPPELGKMRLDVKLFDNNLRLNITTETPEARQILLQRMDTLRAGLEQNGVHLKEFQVITRTPDPHSNQNDQPGRNPHSNPDGSFQQQQRGYNGFSQERPESTKWFNQEETSGDLKIPDVPAPSTALNLVA